MIPVDKALELITEHSEILPVEEIDINNALGRVLAEDVPIDINVPPFNRAAMDGYAVVSSDTKKVPVILEVVEEIPAGTRGNKKISSGKCAKIMTGAPVPADADAVVMIENTEELDQSHVIIKKSAGPLENICPTGEDARAGETILEKGMTIGSAEVGVLCFAGRKKVMVYKKPVVSVIPTGNEIIEHWKKPKDGMIRNINGPMLLSLLKEMGIEGKYSGIVVDAEKEIMKALEKAIDTSDIILLSGGVSMGKYDLVPDVLSKLGIKVIFHKVKIKPGKPLLFGRKGKKLVFGVPGNPVSNLTTFHMFIRPAIKKMMGYKKPVEFLKGYLNREWKRTADRAQVIPARYHFKNGVYHLDPIYIHGSGDLINCRGLNCLCYLEAESPPLKKGDLIDFLPI